jgi:ArsR family transcriptional regulator
MLREEYRIALARLLILSPNLTRARALLLVEFPCFIAAWPNASLLTSPENVDSSRRVDKEIAILGLAALAQSTRLDVFRMLVRHEPDGLPAGQIARELKVPHNTLSTHLAILTRAGLIRAQRRSRSIIYRVDLDRVRALTMFLLKDCCGGRPELCAPLIDDLGPCCIKEAAHA